MSKISKKIILEKIEDNEESSSSDESIENVKQVITKPKKEKKPYVMTEARKLAFEKARETRAKNILLNKELKEKEQEHIKTLKEQVKIKKSKKIEKLSNEIKQISESDSDEEEVIIKKKKPK